MFKTQQLCDAKLAYLDDITNLEIFPYGLHLMLMGNICYWLLQGNGAITRVLAYCKIPCKMNLIED